MAVPALAQDQRPEAAGPGPMTEQPAPRHSGARGMAACRADMATLCQGVAPGRGGAGGPRPRLQCLIDNRDRVSPECAQMLAAIEARGPRRGLVAEAPGPSQPGSPATNPAGTPTPGPGPGRTGGARPMQACRGDAQALCGSAERGPARRQCLMAHETQLSPACSQALAEVAQRQHQLRETIRGACRADRQSLCQPSSQQAPGQGNGGGGAVLRCLRDNIGRVSPACGAALAQLPAAGGAPR